MNIITIVHDTDTQTSSKNETSFDVWSAQQMLFHFTDAENKAIVLEVLALLSFI